MLILFLHRKKFAKLKVKFELGMRESESLIREELRIQDLSKRIQEQNECVSNLSFRHVRPI